MMGWQWRIGWMGAAAVVVCLLVGCARDQQESAVRELFDADYAFTVDDYLRAARDGKVAVLRSYLAAGMGVDSENQFGDRALLLAAERGHGAVVKLLLGGGASVAELGPGLRTALIGAAEAGDLVAVRALLDAGADPRHRDQEGWTALRIAAYHGYPDAVGELIPVSDAGEIDAAMLLAAVGGDVGVLDRLLEAGADVYRRTPERQTALMLAAGRGHRESVELLLQHGANRFATDADGMTAAQLAHRGGQPEIEALLRRPPEVDLAGQPVAVLAESEVERPGEVWQLRGARLEGDPDTERPLAVARYREEQVPAALESVDSDAGQTEFRLLYGGHRLVRVGVGEQVPGTPFEIVAVDRRLTSTKERGGAPVAVERATVRDMRSGQQFVMSADDPGLSAFTYVEFRDARGRSFRGRRGDTFEIGAGGTAVPFRILELRPREVLVERLDDGRVLSLARAAGS